MALALNDRVQQTGTANTTVSFTLSGSVPGFQSFAVIGNGNTTYYSATDSSGNWEVGLGTYSTTGPTLTRTTILSSSNSNTAVTFSGTVNVFVTYPADKSVNEDASGNVNILTYVPNTTTAIGTLNVGDGTYNVTQSGQIASFAGADPVVNGINIQNTSTSNTAYSAVQIGADTFNTGYYLQIGTNSSTYDYAAAGFPNSSINQPNTHYFLANKADLGIATWDADDIHFIQNASTATTDSMTLYANGGVSLGGIGSPGIGNVAVNNAVVGFTAVTSAGGTTVLTSASTQVQALVGSANQTIRLPDATTLLRGTFYTLSNASSGVLTVQDSAGTVIETIAQGGAAQAICTSTATIAGTWGFRVFAASNVTWGNANLDYNGTITSAEWQGDTIAPAYGGTGLTTFTAANNALYSSGASTLTAGTLPILAGGTGATTNGTARTNLGATTVGSNFFTLTNPSAVTFPRMNLDNTVSALSASDFRTAIGAGTSSTTGTVTSVAALTLGTTGTDLSSSVANGTTTPVITLNVPTASATNRGALSSTDWTTFNNKASTAAATSTTLGLIELNSDTVQTVAANAVTGTASRTYGLQVNAAGQGVINVPWTDSGGTVTSVGGTGSINGLSLSGTVTTTGNLTLGGSITSVSTSGNFQMNSLGVGTAGSTTAGEIRATNNITAYYSSDRKLKENIQDVQGALEKVCAIGSKEFDWTDEYIAAHGGEDGYFVTKSDFGVIAQDVQAVFPQAIRTREDGTLAVDYEKLSTLAFGAIKELVKRIEALEAK